MKHLERQTHKSFMEFVNRNGLYCTNNYVRDTVIDAIANLFTDHCNEVRWFTDLLTSPDAKGISGNMSRVKIQGNIVIIKPAAIGSEIFEDEIVEMDRNTLLELAQDWEVLVERNPSKIYIYRKDGRLFISDTLPEGME
jgi:hypothetical protein